MKLKPGSRLDAHHTPSGPQLISKKRKSVRSNLELNLSMYICKLRTMSTTWCKRNAWIIISLCVCFEVGKTPSTHSLLQVIFHLEAETVLMDYVCTEQIGSKMYHCHCIHVRERIGEMVSIHDWITTRPPKKCSNQLMQCNGKPYCDIVVIGSK